MADSQWSLCKACKWWRLEPKAAVENLTMGLCIEEKPQAFRLRVSGNSGYDRFQPGKPAPAEGSGEAPPTARPTRWMTRADGLASGVNATADQPL
jgi:hypothetical protein